MESYERLTSGSLLARNVALNLVGWGAPAVAAVVALPFLVRGLGEARFGILALAWTALGYFSLFDLGIARALTHAVSARLGGDAGRRGEIASVIWTSLVLLAPVGMVGAVLLIALAPWLAETLLAVPAELHDETRTAFVVLGVAIPFTVLTAALRGSLEAAQRFGAVNALRVPYGLLTFLGPLAALPFSESVVPAVAVMSVGRAALCLAYLVVCLRVFPELRHVGRRPDRDQLRSLLAFGSWMTVSNVVSPLMNTLDRFVVGAALTVGMVTYYATPHELVTKMWLFTAALFPVFFPAFATSAGDPARAAALFDRAMRATFSGLFLPTFLFVALAPEILRVWLGPEFALRSTQVMQILAIAVFVNCLAQCALTLIHGFGRPDLSGKFHLIELPIYAVLLWLLLPRFGIVGVAWTWALRASLDTVLLFLASPRVLPQSRATIRRTAIWAVTAVAVLAGLTQVELPAGRMLAAALMVPAWLAIVWWRILTTSERAFPARLLGAVND